MASSTKAFAAGHAKGLTAGLKKATSGTSLHKMPPRAAALLAASRKRGYAATSADDPTLGSRQVARHVNRAVETIFRAGGGSEALTRAIGEKAIEKLKRNPVINANAKEEEEQR